MADQSAIIASIRLGLDQLDKDIESAEVKTEKLAAKMKKSGKEAGDGFLAGMKKGFKETDKQARQFGENIIKSLGPMGLLLSAITFAINLVKDAFGAAMAGNKEASKSFSDIGNILGKLVQPALDALGKALAWVGEKLKAVIEFFTGVSAEAANMSTAIEDSNRQMTESFDEYYKVVEKTNKLVKVGAKTEKEAAAIKRDAINSYIDKLTDELIAIEKVTGANSKEAQSIQAKIAALLNEKTALEKVADAQKSVKTEEIKEQKQAITLSEVAAKAADEARDKYRKERIAAGEDIELLAQERVGIAAYYDVIARRMRNFYTDEDERNAALFENEKNRYEALQEIILATGANERNAKRTFEYLDEVEKRIKNGLIDQIDEMKKKLEKVPEGLIPENLPGDIKKLEELRAHLEDLLKKQEELAQKTKVDTSGLIDQINKIKRS